VGPSVDAGWESHLLGLVDLSHEGSGDFGVVDNGFTVTWSKRFARGIAFFVSPRFELEQHDYRYVLHILADASCSSHVHTKLSSLCTHESCRRKTKHNKSILQLTTKSVSDLLSNRSGNF
jgi:hypothetical protein